MTAVLLGINENRLAPFKAERASILFFFLLHGWPIHIFRVLRGASNTPTVRAHSGCHYHAHVNGLQLMRPLRAAAQPAQAELLPLALCHRMLASGEEQQQQSSEGTAKNH